MKSAPIISETMSDTEVRKNLQGAINSLFALYEDIGKLPYSILSRTELPGIDGLREFHQKAPHYLENLASDDIPF